MKRKFTFCAFLIEVLSGFDFYRTSFVIGLVRTPSCRARFFVFFLQKFFKTSLAIKSVKTIFFILTDIMTK